MFKKLLNTALSKIRYTTNKPCGGSTNSDDFHRLSNHAQQLDTIKIHFGCGPRILKDWINIDVSFASFEPYLQYYTDKHYPEMIRGTRDDLYIINILYDGLPLADESADIIFHEDFFEHLSQKEQIIFLAETMRVLKKGAVHRINTPNLLASMRDNSNFRNGKSGVFTGEWDNWDHHNVISPAILKEMAMMVGYSAIHFNARDQSIAANLLPLEYRPNETIRQSADSNVFADLIK